MTECGLADGERVFGANGPRCLRSCSSSASFCAPVMTLAHDYNHPAHALGLAEVAR